MHPYQGLFDFNWNFLFSIITFLVLFLVLKHFLFERVHNFMEDRSKEVEDTLKNAEETNRIAEEKLADYNLRISDVESESRNIIKKARDEAKNQANAIVEEANTKAKETVEHSRKEIEREKFNANKQLKEEVSTLAIMAAEKIMEQEIDPKKHLDIVDNIIREAEEKPWS